MCLYTGSVLVTDTDEMFTLIQGAQESRTKCRKKEKNRHQNSGKKTLFNPVEAICHTREGRQNQADKNWQGTGQENKRNKTTRALSHQSNKDHLEQKWAKMHLK